LKRDEPEFYTNYHVSNVMAVEMNGRYDSKFGQTGFGIDSRREDLVSSNLGNHQRDILGLYAEHRMIFLKKIDVRAGLYTNYYSQYGLKYFPGCEAGYQLGRRSRLYTNAGISYRIPTYTELYYSDPSTSSNSDLKPEQARSVEVGYRYLKSGLRVETNVFYRHASQLIDYYRPDDGQAVNTAKWAPRNISEANFMGFEAQISNEFEIKDSSIAVQRMSVTYNYLDANIAANQGIQTRYALDHYKHQVIFNAQFMLLNRLSLGGSLRYLQRLMAPSYVVADLKLSYRALRQMTAFIEWTNIGNTKYVEAGYVQMPGRWLKLGLQLKLSKF
jgi:iron complex outermembrane receptor protein